MEQLFLKEKILIPELHFQFKGVQWIPKQSKQQLIHT